MKKILKYAAWSMVAVVAVGGALIAYIALTFDPNAYKPQLIQAVQDKTGRTLKLEGDIKLFFFPSIGADIGQVALSEFHSAQEFAAVEGLRVSLALWPLLSKQVVVDEVMLDGARVRVVKHKDGTSNLDDLLAKPETTTPAAEAPASAGMPLKFDIAAVRITRTAFSYADEGSGARYEISDLMLKTGRIANGAPGKLEFSARAQASQPQLDTTIKLTSGFTFDLDQALYQLKDMQLSADGSVQGQRFDTLIEVPAMKLAGQAFSASGINLHAGLRAAFGEVAAQLAIPAAQGDGEQFKLERLALDVDVKQPQQAFQLKLASPLAGSLKTQQFNLSDLAIGVSAIGEQLPGKHLSSELKGSVQADLSRQSLQAQLAGGLLQSQLKAKLAVNSFAAPAIRYDLELDQFDADLFLPPQAEAKPVQQQATPEQPFDLSALKSLNVEGSVRVGTFKVANVKAKQLRVDVKAKGGQLKVAPFSANLYGGSVAAEVAVDALKSQFGVNAKLNGIEIGPLLQDALKMDFISGKGSVGVNVTTQGDRVSLLKENLNGSLALNLADGAVKGINLAKSLRGLKGDKTQAANREEKTDFSEMTASFKISNGVAHNEDLTLKSPFIRVGGKGDVNLGADSVDYLVKATLAGTAEGQGGRDEVGGLTVPVRVSGPFTDLKFKLEFGSLVADAARDKAAAATAAAKQQAAAAAEAARQQAQQALQAQQEAAKAKAQEQLKQGVKGLFR